MLSEPELVITASKLVLFHHEETEDDVESQHFDESNPQRENKLHSVFEAVTYMRSIQREKIRKEHDDEPKICKKVRKYLCIKNKKSIIFASLITLTLNLLAYLGLYSELSRLTMPAQTVIVSSEGPAAEMYPDSMGQYNILREVVRYDRAVYKHVNREDRFIICAGNVENKIQFKRSD